MKLLRSVVFRVRTRKYITQMVFIHIMTLMDVIVNAQPVTVNRSRRN